MGEWRAKGEWGREGGGGERRGIERMEGVEGVGERLGRTVSAGGSCDSINLLPPGLGWGKPQERGVPLPRSKL